MRYKKPLISVIMPVYNSEKYLAEAIESILNQTYKNFEFIIIDDGSTDNSSKIIREYAKMDNRIKYFKNEKNLGNWATRNRGVDLSKGEYIAMQDSDDISYRNRLAIQLRILQENENIGVLGSSIELIDSYGKTISIRRYPEKDKDLKKMIFFFSPFANPSVMMRKKVFIQAGGFNSNLKVSGDLDLWFKAGRICDFYNYQEPLIKYRYHKDQITNKKLKLMEKIANRIRWENWKDPHYYFGFKAFFYNILHLASIYIIPPKIKLFIYNKLR